MRIHWVLLILVLAYIYIEPTYEHVPSQGRLWKVLDYKNKAEAATLLGKVHAKLMKLMRVLREKYHIDETDEEIANCIGHSRAINTPGDVYNIVANLLSNYNPDNMYENDARGTTETSYTVNKGQAMYLCLRQKTDPNKLVSEDELMFVLLHECAHIANYRGWGHQQNFWEVFLFILHEAKLAGIYTPIDYARKPVDYCGLLIEYNPLLDPNLRRIWV